MSGREKVVERVKKSLRVEEMAALRMVDATLRAILDEVNESGGVELYGFGKFALTTLPARRAAHPVTGQIRTVPALKKLAFRAAANQRVRL